MAIDVGRVTSGSKVVIDTRRGTARITEPSGRTRTVQPKRRPSGAPPAPREEEVKFEVGAKPTEDKPKAVAQTTPVSPRLPVEIVRGKGTPEEKAKALREFVRTVPPKPTTIRERAKQIGKGVIGGVKEAPARIGEGLTFLVPSILKGGTGEFTEAPGGFREVTREEKVSQKFGRQPGESLLEFGARTVTGIGAQVLSFAAVTPSPLGPGLTPTTRQVTVTKVTPKGEFKAVGVIEAGEKALPVAVRGKAVRVDGITVVRGQAVVRTAKPTIELAPKLFKGSLKGIPKRAVKIVKVKLAQKTKFEGFKFKGISKELIKTPTKQVVGVVGKVTKVSKAVAKKGVSKVTKVRPDTKIFAGRQVITDITPGKAITATRTDIFRPRGFVKVGEARGLGRIGQVRPPTPRATPTGVKAPITPTQAKQLSESVLEGIAPSFAKAKPSITLAPSLPRAAPRVAPKQITAPKTTTLPELAVPREDVTQIDLITPRTITRERTRLIDRRRTITAPIQQPIVAERQKLAPILKQQPITKLIQPPVTRTRPATRITTGIAPPISPIAPVPFTPFVPPVVAPFIPELAFFEGKRKKKRGRLQPTRFTPSLTGLFGGFTIKKAPVGKLTGLEIRPLVIGN